MQSTDMPEIFDTETNSLGTNVHNDQAPSGTTFIGGSGLVFAVLQSICTVVVAINGFRLMIGLGALAMTTGLGWELEHFHQREGLRVFFLVGALAGSMLTLFLVRRSYRLRNRSGAQWRKRPMTPQQRRSEYLQVTLSVLTLVLVIVEEYLHFCLCHTL